MKILIGYNCCNCNNGEEIAEVNFQNWNRFKSKITQEKVDNYPCFHCGCTGLFWAWRLSPFDKTDPAEIDEITKISFQQVFAATLDINFNILSHEPLPDMIQPDTGDILT
jgi:hypothetical protein